MALDSLTFGAPLIWLHRSLGLGPELCACLRFPFTNSCSFLSFFCLPAGSKIFCALLHSTPVPSPEFLLSHRQWTAGKGRGAGAGAGPVFLGFGKVDLAVRAYSKGHNSPKGRLCGRDQSGSRAGGFRGHEAGSLVSFGVSHKDPLYFPSEWLWSVTDSL